MNNPNNQDLLKNIAKSNQDIAIALNKIVDLLIERTPKQAAPNYKAVLEKFHFFDWQSINAEVEIRDDFGVATVLWQGDRYKRRSPTNSYGTVIFFSRCIGIIDGINKYERLITFEPLSKIEAEPISFKAAKLINLDSRKKPQG